MGHLWSSAGHHAAGSQGTESPAPSQEGSYRGSIVSGGGRSAPSRVLAPWAASWAVSPRFLPGTEFALSAQRWGTRIGLDSLCSEHSHGGLLSVVASLPRGHRNLQGPVEATPDHSGSEKHFSLEFDKMVGVFCYLF